MLNDILYDCPIIGAVKSDEDLLECLNSPVQIIFILYGNILNISDITKKIHEKNKIPFVHIDLIEGLSNKDIACEYIKNNTMAKGILSTKPSLIKKAKEIGLLSVQRLFILDSLALKNSLNQIKESKADFIEILPGIMPKVIKILSEIKNKKIIAGGLVTKKSEVTSILSSGAIAVSTSNKEIWYL